MKPLIDGDILRYEIGFAAESGWEGEDPPPFDRAAELLDQRIANICASVDATEKPLVFLSGKENFRFAIAKRCPYKKRASKKPYHFSNLTAYLNGCYDIDLSDGEEADDRMAIVQTQSEGSTIICSRDKDLRQVPGWHYGWELGNQPSFGPEYIREPGFLKLSNDRKKLTGGGSLFFYAQLLMGDPVDTVRGLKAGIGPVTAYNALKDCKTGEDALKVVFAQYKAFYGLTAYSEMLEQGQLLWLVREYDENGRRKLWGKK